MGGSIAEVWGRIFRQKLVDCIFPCSRLHRAPSVYFALLQLAVFWLTMARVCRCRKGVVSQCHHTPGESLDGGNPTLPTERWLGSNVTGLRTSLQSQTSRSGSLDCRQTERSAAFGSTANSRRAPRLFRMGYLASRAKKCKVICQHG